MQNHNKHIGPPMCL